MSDAPLITIGMTSYNAADTIERALDSALAQDYPNFEIVIVDDASSDNSAQVIRHKIEGLDNARLIVHDKNTGVAGARSSIIEHARGAFVASFDDDDVSVPERLSVQYKRLIAYEAESGAQYVVCWASGYKIYDNGYKAPFAAIGSQGAIPVGRDMVDFQLYMDRNPDVFFGAGTPNCTMFVRRSLFDVMGLYDPEMRRTEDTDFAIRLGQLGGHFIGCTEELVVQTASTGADKSTDISYKSELALVEKHKGLFIPARRYEYAKDWVALRYYHFGGKRMSAVMVLLKLLVKYPVWTWRHFWRSAPKRLAHEGRMSA